MKIGRSAAIAIACGVIAIILAGGAGLTLISFNKWNPSVLVHLGSADALAPTALSYDPSFVLVAPQAHFDGTYFYAIALDPAATGPEHLQIDRFIYRYGHPGYAWLARVLALRDPLYVPLAMFLIGVFGAALAGWGISRIASFIGRSPWWGLAGALSPGVILSVSMDTSEPIGIGLAALGLLTWLQGRRWRAALWLALACLVKETFLLIPIGLGFWELVAMIRVRSAAQWFPRLASLAVPAIPILSWYVYLQLKFHRWPFQEAPGFSAIPFVGWARSLKRASSLAISGGDNQVGATAIPLIVAIAALIIIGAALSLRARTPFHMIFLVLTAVATTAGWRLLLFPKDLLRELLLSMLFLPTVLASPWNRIRQEDEAASPTESSPAAWLH